MFVEVETLVFLDGSFQRLGDPGFVVIQSHANGGNGRTYILNVACWTGDTVNDIR